jgi:chromosome segregation protein
VSSDATIELDSVETRFADLDRQRGDLEQAKKSLQETIKELDVRCLSRFQEAFEQIRINFGDLFRRLFRGGKADILLAEGSDPLEAGVEIFAQPPGKKLQSISLLSGGERTLTALALLFAAFQYKPSPFCVLDEVDAALDDANVERFLGMLEEFKSTTQFIVVTHHRRTMASCSALLGVTMPERGVSQKVAVLLDEVDSVVPGAVGSLPSNAQKTNGDAIVEIVPMPPRNLGIPLQN